MTALALTEAQFQAQVVELAGLCGWRVLHVRRSIGKGSRWTTTTSLVGWPDLVLMRPPDGLVFAELKTDAGKVTTEQTELLAFLDRYPFATARVWRPAHWPEIQETLARRQVGHLRHVGDEPPRRRPTDQHHPTGLDLDPAAGSCGPQLVEDEAHG